MNAANQNHTSDDTAQGRKAPDSEANAGANPLARIAAGADRGANQVAGRQEQAEAPEAVVRRKRLRDLRHLTIRDRKFLRAYIAMGTKRCGSDAMKSIGFAGTQPKIAASKVLAKPGVREYLTQIEEAELDELGVTQHNVIADVLEIRKKAKNLGDAQGLSVALKANDMLGKFKKLWVDQSTPHSPGTTVNDNRVQIQVIQFADSSNTKPVASS
jgi:hypothetical protein